MAFELPALVLHTLLTVPLLYATVQCAVYRLYNEDAGYGIAAADAKLYYVPSVTQCGLRAASASSGVFSAAPGPAGTQKCLVAPPGYGTHNLTDGAALEGQLIYEGEKPPASAPAASGDCLTKDDIVCETVGKKYYHPTNCTKYLECVESGQNPIERPCAAGTYNYDPVGSCGSKKTDGSQCTCQTTQ